MTIDLSEIRERRKALGISRKVLSINSGVCTRLISLVECEGYRSITVTRLEKLLKALTKLEKQGVGRGQ